MNVYDEINKMEHNGWCDGCKHNADMCRKMYRVYGYKPPCMEAINEKTV